MSSNDEQLCSVSGGEGRLLVQATPIIQMTDETCKSEFSTEKVQEWQPSHNSEEDKLLSSLPSMSQGCQHTRVPHRDSGNDEDNHENKHVLGLEDVGFKDTVIKIEDTTTLKEEIKEEKTEIEEKFNGDETVEDGLGDEMCPVGQEPEAEPGLGGNAANDIDVPTLDVFDWSNDFTMFSGFEETYLRVPGPQVSFQNPVDIFLEIWDKDVIDMIARQTNEYACQEIACKAETGAMPKTWEAWKDVTTDEMYRFFVMIMVMSMCILSELHDYWKTDGPAVLSQFKDIMTYDRFILIHSFLHFVNNYNVPIPRSIHDHNISKIRPILEHCNAKFLAMYTPLRHLSLDETLLSFNKGDLSLEQYACSEAARCSKKVLELCEAETGYLLRCLIYDGTYRHESVINGIEIPASNVVLELLDGFLDLGHCLVMDNWYNQLLLARYLKSRGTDVIGNLNRQRKYIPEDIKHVNAQRMARGHLIARHCGDITLIAWKDQDLITTMSTYHRDDCISHQQLGQPLQVPTLVRDYNHYMEAMDMKDQMLSKYWIGRNKDKKWYVKVFKRLLNSSLLNAYIIYQKNPMRRVMTYPEFRWEVIHGILQRFSPTLVPCSLSVTGTKQNNDTVRLNHNDHFPKHTEEVETSSGTRIRKELCCVLCSIRRKRTMVTIMCKRCNVALCAGPCWLEYHTIPILQ